VSTMTDCATCGGEGTVIEFHRFAGEYMAGEPVEVECEDCCGTGEADDEPETCRICKTELNDGECPASARLRNSVQTG
jgi:DnaJ-class molecular chaperone